jgi:rubrerythrin
MRPTTHDRTPLKRCPVCGASAGVPVAYGHPDEELKQAAERGEVVLGGCHVERDPPSWHCTRCGYRWGHQGPTV